MYFSWKVCLCTMYFSSWNVQGVVKSLYPRYLLYSFLTCIFSIVTYTHFFSVHLPHIYFRVLFFVFLKLCVSPLSDSCCNPHCSFVTPETLNHKFFFQNLHPLVEMYTCFNTALGRKRKNRWFCFCIFKTPPLFFYYNFSSKHVCLTIRIERCSPVRWRCLCMYVFSWYRRVKHPTVSSCIA